jgi:hypothetical protein
MGYDTDLEIWVGYFIKHEELSFDDLEVLEAESKGKMLFWFEEDEDRADAVFYGEKIEDEYLGKGIVAGFIAIDPEKILKIDKAKILADAKVIFGDKVIEEYRIVSRLEVV